jgi:hypothetical protein
VSSSLAKRVFCNECGAVRICQGWSPHAVCPNGHGRLVPRFNRQELRKAIVATIPLAQRVRRHAYQITGHEGLFDYRAGSGRQPAGPDTPVEANEVVACYLTPKRAFVRVFARKP